MPDTAEPSDPTLFAVLNEVNILAQLSAALIEARLPPGLLVSHFGVANHLARGHDGATPLSLARAFQVPKTTMTHTLAVLERHGFIAFEGNPRDGRSKCVRLTDAGRRFREDAIAAVAPDMAAIAAELPEGAAGALLPDLRRLRMILDRMRDGAE
jgi:DNA-binding MarR family transcriptional regulator